MKHYLRITNSKVVVNIFTSSRSNDLVCRETRAPKKEKVPKDLYRHETFSVFANIIDALRI
jgi:hypothetical protein